MDAIAILDFGSQYSQLIARRVRELNVYCQLFPFDTPYRKIQSLHPKGYILSGGPASIYSDGAPQLPAYVLESKLPVLGICYGMQALTHASGGAVAPSQRREYGLTTLKIERPNPLLPAEDTIVWMSHADRIERPPSGFEVLARSSNSPIAAMGDPHRGLYGLQFHPEVRHTIAGSEILQAFVVGICGARPEWTPDSIVTTSIDRIRSQVGDGAVIAGVSGGVDSAVAATLVHRAVGDQLTCILIDTGLLRHGEAETVRSTLERDIGLQIRAVDASERFLSVLSKVTQPEAKRRIIGEHFIRVFEEQARQIDHPRYLVQGTIYPDVIESSGPDHRMAARIKSHHNVGGLPPDLEFELVEPLRDLFKDEVRAVGLTLGLPEDLIWRQPFPGPGLAVRCLGEASPDRLQRLRSADKIVTDELDSAGLLRGETAQAFAVLLPVRSVGVMGDQRTYAETVVVRAVTTDDFMTADWARLPDQVLAQISNRIVNEVPGINRVVYDITSKPPATIEWE